MKIMRIPSDMLAYSQIYTQVVFIGFIGMFVYNMGAAILRAIGDSRRPFYYLIAGLVINLALDLLFVLVFRWGVVGAAAATAISQFVSAGLVVIRLCMEKSSAHLSLGSLRFHGKTMLEMTNLGVPMGISGILYSVSNIAIQSTVNSLGTDLITGWSVHVKISSVIWNLYEAFGITASTFVAQNFGAKKIERVHESVKSSLLVGMAVILPVSLLLFTFVRPLAHLFIRDGIVINYAAYIERFESPFYIFYLFGHVWASSIRGCGETFKPMLITLIGTCGFRIAWVIMVHVIGGPTVFNVTLGYPVSWFFNSTLVALYFFFGGWKKRLTLEPSEQKENTVVGVD